MPSGTLKVISEYRGNADRQIEALLLLLQEERVPEINGKPPVSAEGRDEIGGNGFGRTTRYHQP